MANLNLSEFGEKLFVADADHTFIWDTAGAISKRVSRNSWLNSGTLTSDAPVTISQTWAGTGSTVFKALVVNATTPGTTSSSSSLLLDLQVGTVSQFSVTKAGAVNATGAVSTPAQFIAGDAIFANGNGVRYVSTWIRSAGFDGGLLFRNNTQTQSVGVVVEADNTLALRNGTAAQTFNVYGTSSSNNTVYERMFMRYTAASTLAFQIGTETVGATARPLEFLTAGTRKLVLTAIGNNTATIYSAANSTANILTLRNLSETAKFEFNLNASGNAGLYLGTNTLISEVGNSYFNGGNVGIGTASPTSKLHVAAGDVEVDTIAKGVILKSPDGTRYRVTVANGGTLSVAAV